MFNYTGKQLREVNHKTVVIEAPIVAKQRPHARAVGRHAMVYTPKETIMYENLVRMCYKEQCDNYSFGKKPVAVWIEVYFKKTNEIEKLGKVGDCLPKISKPDLDNIIKSVLDGLSNAWDDDSQVWHIGANKVYDPDNKERVEVTIIEEGMTFEEAKEYSNMEKEYRKYLELLKIPKPTKSQRERIEKYKEMFGDVIDK